MTTPASRRAVTGRAGSGSFQRLLEVASGLEFRPHRIGHLLDARGRHTLELPAGFPFAISLFHFREGAVTRRPTWHERLELLIPLDGPMTERMGDLEAALEPGDVLVVDHLKPHQVADSPGLDSRVVVLSFLPECLFSAGSPPTDAAFLIPFHRSIEGRPHVLRARSSLAAEAHDALARLLRFHFDLSVPHREAGCKAWLLVLLSSMIQEFRGSMLERAELLRRQALAVRLKPVLDRVRDQYAVRFPLGAAARLAGMSPAVFSRAFKRASGMTFSQYVNRVRMTHAVALLEETGESVAAIACRLGFCDQSHFDRRFRQTFGRTPTQHRTQTAGPAPERKGGRADGVSLDGDHREWRRGPVRPKR